MAGKRISNENITLFRRSIRFATKHELIAMRQEITDKIEKKSERK